MLVVHTIVLGIFDFPICFKWSTYCWFVLDFWCPLLVISNPVSGCRTVEILWERARAYWVYKWCPVVVTANPVPGWGFIFYSFLAILFRLIILRGCLLFEITDKPVPGWLWDLDFWILRWCNLKLLCGDYGFEIWWNSLGYPFSS